MKITVLGSLGNINRHFLPRLIAENHDVTVVTSSVERISQIEEIGAKAAVGNMNNADFLTETFKNSDVVYLMISAAGGAGNEQNLDTAMEKQAAIFAQAIQNSGVKNVVNLSSIGADNPSAGALWAYHHIENALSNLTNLNSLAIIRPVGFYNNLFQDLPSIKSDGTIYNVVKPEITRAYVDPADIAAVVFDKLTNISAGKSIKYVVSQFATGNDWIAELEKNGISANYQVIPPASMQAGMEKMGLSTETAELFVKMTVAQEKPDFYKTLHESDVHQGKITLSDFAQKFAAVYKNN